jgi:hypothetical protein
MEYRRKKSSFDYYYPILAIIASATALVFILVIIPFLIATAQNPHEEERRILTLDSKYDYDSGRYVTKVDYIKVGDMKPNTSRWFLDPFGKTMESAASSPTSKIKPGATLSEPDWNIITQNEPFEFYTIIRLPEWLGGSADSLSAYRAYSAVAISDQCLTKYWGTDGRWLLVNPCAGDMYRPWDGVATAGPAAVGVSGRGIITSGYFGALASLALSIDNEGYITAKKPNKDYSANGVAGEGRRFSSEMIIKSDKEMINAASEYSGYNLPFLASIDFGKKYLWELRPTSEPWSLEYPNYKAPKIFEAIYSSSPSSGDLAYGETVIRSYPLDDFPSLRLDSPLMTFERIDLGSSKNNSQEYYTKLNQTTINSLIHLDWYDDNVSGRARSVQSGTNIAGTFSVFIAPQEVGSRSNSNEAIGAGALIWGKSIDGKEDILVTIRTSSMDMSELIALGKSLPLR